MIFAKRTILLRITKVDIVNFGFFLATLYLFELMLQLFGTNKYGCQKLYLGKLLFMENGLSEKIVSRKSPKKQIKPDSDKNN